MRFAMIAFAMLWSVGHCLSDNIHQTTKEAGIFSPKSDGNLNQLEGSLPQSLYSDQQRLTEPPNTDNDHSHQMRYHVASFEFEKVAAPFIITAWIFVACCAKIGFHVSPKLVNYCPESCMLLLVGVALGLVLFFSGMQVDPLTPNVFFFFMLPPIVFDAGYFMPNRLFFDNIISILVYAVLGTVWNALSIGLSLWAVGQTGLFGFKVTLLDMLLFSSIVSAVDPVAVLAVFEEIHVNEVLYIIVFGESLLNDAVTVVLYHMFEGYAEMGIPNLLPIDYFSGIASFFVVSVGGTCIGILFGILTAFLSKYTTSVAVIEPMFPFIMGYMAYLFAEMFHLSGIMSLVFCGITMKNYVEENISDKSHVTVKYVTKMLATASETIIFVVLGVSTVNDDHDWNTYFVLLSIIFCSCYRAIGVIVLSAFLNKFRLHQLNGVEQFIMSYGGLRGAVAFALALIIDERVIPVKNTMVTTIIAVVYFTVFVQGMTIKFFVRILKVPQKSDKELTMNERLHSTVIDHLMGGIEEVADQFLGNYKIRDRFKYFNNRYLRRFLTNHSEVNEPKIFETHSKLNLVDAMNMVNSGSKTHLEPTVSLSTVIKNYTAANLTTLAPDETGACLNPSPLMNLDIGEITYNPSFKDLADTEIHHILEDAMFKPQKRTRRYSHSQFDEHEPKHPPFHHHMRLQIRRLVSENRRRRRRYRLQTNGTSDSKVQPISTIYLQSSPKHPQVTITSAGEEDPDDCGIMFSVDKENLPETEPEQQETTRTLTETVLPWKRDDESTIAARPQEQFPTWVNNREYYPGYLSPTPTFLESLGNRPPGTPDFGLLSQSIEEEDDECFESQQQNHPEDQSTVEELGTVQEDIIQEVMTEAQQSRRASQRDRQRFFRNSSPSRRSPDDFSLSSIQSGASSSSTSATLSIECPDVVIDLENDGGFKDTKL